MKRIIALLCALCFMYACCLAEETDYSWLDDLTINQLKELDKEIHKRIPGEQKPAIEPDEMLLGSWSCEYREHDYFKNAPSNDNCRTTYTFNVGGTGLLETFNITKDKLSANGTFLYEMSDENTVTVTSYGLLTSVTTLTIIRSGDEITLTDVHGRVFTKAVE